MIVEELMPLSWPANERQIPEDVRAREIARRTEANLLRWHIQNFGEIAGPLVFHGYQRHHYGARP